jgi:S-adenosyl-L-methionine hydrolase (adenosine-forming)
MFHRSLISLTTDFGYDGPCVGVMKGVIYTINPQVNIVDLSHNIHPQNIQEAAFTIGMNYSYFPKNSIHVVVVDPGVGSVRRPLLICADGHYFIGPDNGVFSYLYTHATKDLQVVHVTSEHLFLKKDSPTFQGRDVFSPCAAWLSTGLEIDKFGETITDYHNVQLPAVMRQAGLLIQGEVLFTDRFGNAITNITKADIDDLRRVRAGDIIILFKDNDIQFREYYAQSAGREISALINSSEHLELFIYKGSAASESNILPGDEVKVFLSS